MKAYLITPATQSIDEVEVAEKRRNNPDFKTRTPYRVSNQMLETWTDFLRNCGGFEVW